MRMGSICLKITAYCLQEIFCSVVLRLSETNVSKSIPLKNLEPSRRDDIISLLYMLVYLINGKNHWLGELNPGDVGYFRKVGQIKK
jgi:hypothetical protein